MFTVHHLRLENLPDARACCAWAAPWSIFIANPFGRSRTGSRSTSTTRSMRFMAASSCGSSMRIMTNMVFSRSSYSTPGAATSQLRFAPPNGRALNVARRAVRHVAPAAHQDRDAHSRDEDDDPSSPADVVPRRGYSTSRTGAYPPPRHLSDGAWRPEPRVRPVSPQISSIPPSGATPEKMRRIR